MRKLAYLFVCLLACGTVMVAMPRIGHTEETIQRTLRGTVIATNVDADPQTVVVSVPLPNKEELIVGARVPRDTRIMRGKQAARLADLKVGEMAEITYLKAPDGLIARSIHVR